MTSLRTPASKSLANYLAAAVLVIAPFHAFLSIWGSSLVGHYTVLRLWDDVLLALLVGVISFWLVRDKPLRVWLFGNLLVRLITAYAALTLLLGLISYLKGDVTPKALAYGILVNLRYLFWFLAVAVAAEKSDWLKAQWHRLLLGPAVLVVALAALQFTVLPQNFLSHFGYNAATNIAPIETINHNANYIRVQSTLRGANPLGAYLVIVASGLAVIATAQKKRRLIYVFFGAITLVALFATGSRSAWIGTFLAVGVLAWFRLRTRRGRTIFAVAALAIVSVAVGLFMVFRNNTGIENTVLHTQKHSAVATSSNANHASALRAGLRDVIHQPFGDGPGTAGPASAYNGSHGARIAENYFVQIAQETGWLGLGLLLTIFVVVAIDLCRRCRASPLALVLLASLVGLTVVNMLSHAWVDDTLAYVWWGLAGIALARPRTASDEV
jgi:O-antigen ligase